MAVETRYVVVREGKEMQTFTDKKQADAYDAMLDQADALVELLQKGPVELAEDQAYQLCEFFARNREEVSYALGLKKRPQPKKAVAEPETETSDEAA